MSVSNDDGMSTHLVYILWWVASPCILFISCDDWHVHTSCLYPMMSRMSTHFIYIQWVACPHILSISSNEWHVHTSCLYTVMSGMSTHLIYIQPWVACPHILSISSNEWHVHTSCLYPRMSGMSTHLVYIQSELSELGALLPHGPGEITVSLSAIILHNAWPRIFGIPAVLSALHFEVHSVIGSYSLFFIAIK